VYTITSVLQILTNEYDKDSLELFRTLTNTNGHFGRKASIKCRVSNKRRSLINVGVLMYMF